MTGVDDRLRALGIVPIGRGFVPVSVAELREIESRLGRSLPEGYRQFAGRYGYSGFEGHAHVNILEGRPGLTEVPIMNFFGGSERGQSVLAKYEENKDRFPQASIPIGRDPFGNLFFLSLGCEKPGSIWYANFSQEVAPPRGPGPDGDWYFETVIVANTFEEFVDQILIEPDDD